MYQQAWAVWQMVIFLTLQPSNEASFQQKYGWNMLSSSASHHIFNLVAIEPVGSEKLKMSNWGVLVKTLQGLGALGMSVVAVGSRVQWFNGSVVQRRV